MKTTYENAAARLAALSPPGAARAAYRRAAAAPPAGTWNPPAPYARPATLDLTPRPTAARLTLGGPPARR